MMRPLTTIIMLSCTTLLVLLVGSSFAIFRDPRQAEFFKQVSSYEIVHPIKVTANGDLISHDLHHDFAPKSRKRREARSVEDDSVHYHLSLSGENIRISLSPNHRLIAPGMVIERRSSRLNATVTPKGFKRAPDSHCWYHGHIVGKQESKVAISTCRGLTGMIQSPIEDYFIEPLKGFNATRQTRHPHLVYKRSAIITTNDAKQSHEKMCGNHDESISHQLSERSIEERQEHYRHPRNFRRRKKRSVSVERNVETLVVADKVMIDYYSNEDIETYILTVMNMVSSLYHDASIGNAINIVLVRMILLENDDQEKVEDLDISHHADNTLKSFCRWQKYINPKNEDHPNHHDVAILMTRYNICTRLNEPCSTLGLAEVAGMCQPQRSCNVNEDTGLALAYTIAHEMGHNFGMSHDGPHNGCEAPLGERQHVMSPHLNSDASPLVWSNCSRNEITKFLDRDWGSCLDDEPSEHDFSFPELPPGAMYDADHQCRLQYGPNAEFCDDIEDVCQTLWCRLDNKCVTRLEPAAEGTLCNRNMWCYMGKCTTIGERPQSIDGEWGQWSEWSECSRTCGAGVKYSDRHCDNPMPANGGRYCIGERKRYRVCKTEPCPENTPSFRAMQCDRYKNVPYKNELYNWQPVFTPSTPCQLHCKPEGKFFSVMLSDTVDDGTPCQPGTRDMCINGKCRKVSCDWGIDSDAQEDRCGVCHGDGTHCQTIRGEYNERQGLGYSEVVIIPKGSRNIKVEELAEDNNYIAIQALDGEFYLNGQWFIQWSGEYRAVGTTFYYRRDGELENLHAPGPIREDIRVMLLFQGENHGLRYEYTVPNENITRNPEFYWEYSDWSVCSATCGGGVQVSKARCVEKEAGLVEEKYCNSSKKPDDTVRFCNKHQCPAKWWAGPWQLCSVTCGDNGVRRRTVICVRSLGPDEQIALHNDDCDASDKPSELEPCRDQPPCPGITRWETGEWSDTCKDDPCGYQTRRVFCSSPDGLCDERSKPQSMRKCSNVKCGTWVEGDWSECSQTCGDGVQLRKVTCEGGISCQQDKEPTSIQICKLPSCNVSENAILDSHNNGKEVSTKPEEKVPTVKCILPDEAAKHHKHRHHHGNIRGTHRGGCQNVTDREQPKNNNKRKHMGIAIDMVKTPIYEIPLSPDNRDKILLQPTNPTSGEGSGGKHRNKTAFDTPKLRKEPAVVPEKNKDNSEPDGHKYEWKVGVWSKCTKRCDTGLRTREILCFDMVTRHMVVSDLCNPYKKPRESEPCNTHPCLQWIVSKWTECSLNCGGGYQTRQVKCINYITEEVATDCNPKTKPIHLQLCNIHECPQHKSAFQECQDDLSQNVCKNLLHMCSTWYIKIKCCHTCNQLRSAQKLAPSSLSRRMK